MVGLAAVPPLMLLMVNVPEPVLVKIEPAVPARVLLMVSVPPLAEVVTTKFGVTAAGGFSLMVPPPLIV